MAAKKADSEKVGKSKKEDLTSKRRILAVYDQIMQNNSVSKEEFAEKYKVSERTIERDIETINGFLAEEKEAITFPLEDKKNTGKQYEDDEEEPAATYKVAGKDGKYSLNKPVNSSLQYSEVFTVLKMLLDCRGLNEKEMKHLQKCIIESCIAQKDQNKFKEIINEEALGYRGPRHGKDLIEKVWELKQAMRERYIIRVMYTTNLGKEVNRKLIPVGIIYNEFYFYLIAYIKSKTEEKKPAAKRIPTVYRIDRINDYVLLNEKFTDADLPYKWECNEQKFRERIQFMYIEPLEKVIFTCTKEAEEAALDRFPSAEIRSRTDDLTEICAVVYGKHAVDMWMRSQGSAIKEWHYVKYVGVEV